MSPRALRIFRAIVSEPLVHFASIGALLFALGQASGADPDEHTIRVTDAIRRELADGFAHEHGQPPTEAELDALVEGWARDEVLYREGLERGLDRGDPGVRSRIASSMAFVLQQRVHVPEPTEDELRAFYDAHAERWSEDELVDFTHVFVEGADDAARTRAREILDRVRAGALPAGLGDTFTGGRRYRRRRLADLAATFGDAFVEGLATQEIGAWELRTSRFGLHLVHVDARSAASAASFEMVRDEVAHAWTEARRRELSDRELEALRADWTIAE